MNPLYEIPQEAYLLEANNVYQYLKVDRGFFSGSYLYFDSAKKFVIIL